MPVDQIVRANRSPDSLFGGVGVREFAACEFPREDIAWVATWTREPRSSKGRGRSVWARLRGVVGTPVEREPESEIVSDTVTG